MGESFWVIQLFDREGYVCSCVAFTESEAKVRASRKTGKNLLAATVPFQGTWSGKIPDVSVPLDFREAVAMLDRGHEED